jgi:hypothetical protein
MTLNLIEQWNFSINQDDFRHRVAIGIFNAAVVAFGAAPLSDPTKQIQRVGMIKAILNDPIFGIDVFARYIVSDPTITTEAGLTDALINSKVTFAFDIIAQQLITVDGEIA